MIDVVLTHEEVAALTTYVQPSAQLAELRRQGFWRARLGRHGRVILERAHYEAVCAGTEPPQRQPRLRTA